MILFEIDAAGFAIFEFEGDAPGSIDVNRIAPRVESVQRMKVEARNVHFLGSNRNIEPVQPGENALIRIDLRTLALGPKLRKGLALEGSDHKST